MRSVNKPPIVSITLQGENFTGHGAVDFYVLNGKYNFHPWSGKLETDIQGASMCKFLHSILIVYYGILQ